MSPKRTIHKIWYDHDMAPKPWISIPNIKIYLETKFRPNWRIFVFWWPFWIQNGHHIKPTMDINSQHHNLLGNQISPKSDDFCIWRPFCTSVTMATATILNFFNPPKAATHYGGYSYKVSWSLMKGIQIFFKSPLFCFHGNCGKVCPTDSDFFGLSRSTRCGCCSYQVSSISVWRVTCYDHFCVFQFFSIFAVSMATVAILKKSTLNSTTSHGIWYSYKVS